MQRDEYGSEERQEAKGRTLVGAVSLEGVDDQTQLTLEDLVRSILIWQRGEPGGGEKGQRA